MRLHTLVCQLVLVFGSGGAAAQLMPEQPLQLCVEQGQRPVPRRPMDDIAKGVIRFLRDEYVAECDDLHRRLQAGQINPEEYSRAISRLTESYYHELIGYTAARGGQNSEAYEQTITPFTSSVGR
jgi:hypothetical protein